jgi:hypothetical protein
MIGILRRFWPHILCATAALALWDTPVVKPFRFFMVMIHELCHAAAALVSGGEVTEIRTHWNESGYTMSRGGVIPLISSAGYVGAAFLGAFTIYVGSWPAAQRVILGVIGCAVMWMTFLYTPVMGIDFVFGLLSGAVLLGTAAQLPRVSRWAATWLGVMLCLYSLYDFRTDLWSNTANTDAGILANHWGIPLLAYPIAAVWALVSVLAMFLAMRGVERRGRRADREALRAAGVPPQGSGTAVPPTRDPQRDG